jgi:L-amino acid N-acyltransferase YncA
MIRPATLSDSQQIADIYNYYVLNTHVTFEEEAVSSEEMTSRIKEVTEKYPWLVNEENNEITGYSYAGPWKSRCAYKFSVETAVYVRNGHSGKKIGSSLYEELLKRLSALHIHGVIGGVALPNDACISLHKKFGFEKVAQFKEVGYKFERWIDVTYWERILTRSE